MKKYFLDPVSKNLIIADNDSGQVSVIEPMKNVRVFVNGEDAYMLEGHEDNDNQSGTKPPKQKRACSFCGGSGHSRRTCPNAGGDSVT